MWRRDWAVSVHVHVHVHVRVPDTPRPSTIVRGVVRSPEIEYAHVHVHAHRHEERGSVRRRRDRR